MGWLAGWPNRNSVTLTRESGALSNYPMKILVGESAGSSGANVHCFGHGLSSFNDLRFTASDGETLLDYWIESISGTTPNQVAVVWVEFDAIETSATTFFMYYGNTEAAAYSSGVDTFPFFDHFTGTSLDTTKWTSLYSNESISSSLATFNSTSGAGFIYSKSRFGLNYAIRTRALLQTVAYNTYSGFVGFFDGTTNATGSVELSIHTTWRYVNGRSGIDSSNVSITPNTIAYMAAWHVFDIARLSSKSRFACDNGSWTDLTTNIPTKTLTVDIGKGQESSYTKSQCDWILVRPYVEDEPVWGTWVGECVGPPLLTTQEASDVAGKSFTANGAITDSGGGYCSRRGFCYLVGSSGEPTIDDIVVEESGDFLTGAYSLAVSGLAYNTAYRVRAFAENTAGLDYGDTVSVTTLTCAPEVSTQSPTAVSTIGAILHGTIDDPGGIPCTRRGFCWIQSSAGTPTVADQTIEESGSFSAGSFSMSFDTVLRAETDYRACAFAENSIGITYGAAVSLKTSVYADPLRGCPRCKTIFLEDRALLIDELCCPACGAAMA